MLNTVTYGTASASFLTVSSVFELAAEGSESHPLTSQALVRDSYLDDIVSSGASSIQEAQTLARELVLLLQSGSFELAKWGSSQPEAVAEFQLEQIGGARRVVKTLGILWDPQLDKLQEQIDVARFQQKSLEKKNDLLSLVASVFDPLGWLSPITIMERY